jgi:hypothetical protein
MLTAAPPGLAVLHALSTEILVASGWCVELQTCGPRAGRGSFCFSTGGTWSAAFKHR